MTQSRQSLTTLALFYRIIMCCVQTAINPISWEFQMAAEKWSE